MQKIRTSASRRQEGIVVLEDIYDPHNAAAVLRSCEAFGIQKVYFIQHHFLKVKSGAGFIFEKGKKFNPKKIGKATSSSANKWLDFEVFDSTKKCFKKLKRQGYSIVATVLDDKAKSIFRTKFTKPKIALCIGNEHAGLSAEAIELSDQRIYIPMRGFVQSLNLSVTAAICLFELSRQRQESAKKFLLPRREQNLLIKNWKQK